LRLIFKGHNSLLRGALSLFQGVVTDDLNDSCAN
jgi:hypothetical protein